MFPISDNFASFYSAPSGRIPIVNPVRNVWVQLYKPKPKWQIRPEGEKFLFNRLKGGCPSYLLFMSSQCRHTSKADKSQGYSQQEQHGHGSCEWGELYPASGYIVSL